MQNSSSNNITFSAKMAPDCSHGFELLCKVNVVGLIPVEKYKSLRTGLTVCVANVPGPLVNGYLCVATEAHDDDGLPHTLEHLVFMGSEEYPYKGLLDLLANRCLAQGTNAWTDVDHTTYTLTTAGNEGFLNMLPIYMDHVLYPTLTKSAYITEVHHINGEGEDAGIVYCEMQARENSGASRTYLELTRSMYPGHCGYKSETGGLTKNLRTTCSHEKVCKYHASFYHPENLCVIVTGQVNPDDVLLELSKYEEKIISKGQLPKFTRPWQTPVPPLLESVESIVKFPTEDESNGLFYIGWRGPNVKEYYKIAAIDGFLRYLTETSAAILQKELVEIDDPFCSDLTYSVMENQETCFYLKASGVPKDKLFEIRERVEKVLTRLSSGELALDMERLHTVINLEVLDSLDKYESDPHEAIAQGIIGDFLYSSGPNDLVSYLDDISRLRKLRLELEEFWIQLLKKYIIDKPKVVIIGEPSEQLMTDMTEEEKKRLEVQKTMLGESGLAEKGDELESAIEENEEEPPVDLITSMKVPSTNSIRFHGIETITNVQLSDHTAVKTEKLQISEIPFSVQVDDIKSLFLQLTIILDTSALPEDLRFYLPLFADIIFESPILRDGQLIPHGEIVKQLAADTLTNSASTGICGDTFVPGKFSTAFMLQLRMEVNNFEKGIQWLRELLYCVQFTAERIKIVGNRIINDIPSAKRNGRKVAQTLINDIYFVRGSNYFVSNVVRQQKFLMQTMEKLLNEPQQVIDDMEKMRQIITNPRSLQLFIAVDAAKLQQDAYTLVHEKFLPKEKMELIERAISIKPDYQLTSSDYTSKIVGIGAVSSAFLYQSSPCVTSYLDDDYAPILVLIEYLCALEGPLWRQIRGSGLAYHYHISIDPSSGKLTFMLMKSTHIFAAFQKGKQIVSDFITGEAEFEDEQLEAAVSGVIFQTIEGVQTVGDAAYESMVSRFKGVHQNFNKHLLQKVSQVTIDDLQNVSKKYFLKLFDTSSSCCALCCHPSKVENIVKDFESIGIDLKVVDSFDDEFSF